MEATLAPLITITAVVAILGTACALSCRLIDRKDRPQVVGRFISAGVILALAAIGGPAVGVVALAVPKLLDRGG